MKKQTKLSSEIKASRQLYEKKKRKSLTDLSDEYQRGEIGKYDYISEMKKKYSVLFELQKVLEERRITSLLVSSGSLVFKLKENDVKFFVDSSCRSSLFELLNFGSYEANEMKIFKGLLKENDVVFDIGAHLGWYSVMLAKVLPTVKFYAFEPIKKTFDLLCKNISVNKISNIESFNFGLSDTLRNTTFYYSEVGSAVASEKNIFDVENLTQVKCRLRTIDDFMEEKKIKKLDFIKCDVEGAEFLVIKGGERTIRRFFPILFLELVENWCIKFSYTLQDLVGFLTKIEYKMFEIKKNALSPIQEIHGDDITDFNFFFLHQRNHKKIIRNIANQ